MLHTGLPWEWLPQELGFGSGMTCWRRLRDWQAAGVWGRLHRLLLEELHQAGQIDGDRAAVDGSHIRAMRGGEHTGPSPVDRARPGSKHHLIVQGRGSRRPTALEVVVSGFALRVHAARATLNRHEGTS